MAFEGYNNDYYCAMCHQKFGYFKLIQKAIPIDVDLDDPTYEIDTSRVCIDCESVHRQMLYNRYNEKERAEVKGEVWFSTADSEGKEGGVEGGAVASAGQDCGGGEEVGQGDD